MKKPTRATTSIKRKQICFNCGRILYKGRVDYCGRKCKVVIENNEGE